MAALGSQTIASSYEQLLHVDRDGGGDTTTHVNVKDGDNGTTFGFTIASDALMMTGTNRLEFGDTGTYIHQSADGVLDLVSDTEIEINATTIDMNGAADLSGNLTIGGNIDANGDSNFQGDITTQSKILVASSGQGIFGAGDGDTGIRWETNDVLAFDTEGTERFYLDANGTLTIDQNENQKSLVIDSEATTNHTLSIEDSVTTEGSIIKATSCNALTNGKILEIHSDSNDNSTRNLVSITNDHTSADNAVGLYIQQDGADASIELAGNVSIKFPGTQGASSDANRS